MITFPEHKDCKECPLWESATNPGIPTRSYSAAGKSKAVLIVGEAPGFHEDAEFKSWIGHSGTILTRFIDATHLADYADIYLSNACRCRPPQNSDPTSGNVNTCRQYLQEDLELLHYAYDRSSPSTIKYEEVIIFCCGRWGTQAVTKQSTLTGCFSMQGRTLDYFNGLKAGGLEASSRVFFTYHPAMLLPNRQPHQVTTVADHFTLLLRYLKGEMIPNSLEVIPQYNAPVPKELPPTVCVDIETYGILKGSHQSVFHPVKSHWIDNVLIGNQITTVAFGFVDTTAPTGFQTFVYDFKKHRPLIRRWFRHIVQSGTTLIGQNTKFDIAYLKMNDPVLNELLNVQSLQLDDTLLVSFLFYEQRPEKGLKELATLFGITDYRSLKVTASSATAKNARDPALLYYNCLDVATTLALYYFTWSQIKERYGEDSPKLSKTCWEMRNAVLWDTIMLELSGCAMDRDRVYDEDQTHRQMCDDFIKEAENCGVLIAGEGSEKSSRGFMTMALERVGLLNDNRVQLTKKKREISVGIDNFNLLVENSNEEHSHWKPLQAIKGYHKASKIVSSYTNKLLNTPAKGLVYGNMTYPSWYPSRAIGAKYAQEVGGTIQARFSARNPAAQTYPEVIKKCLTSRFPAGQLTVYDLSQIELRVAALLSGDPVMLDEYAQGIDRHAQTAMHIWPNSIRDKEWKTKRWAGKQLNFLVLYRGGALKFQETLLHDAGLSLPLHKCKEIIEWFNRRYPVFRAWQDGLIETVRAQGYLELPTGWSRTWGTGKAADSAISEICDFPIQTIAAQLLQSAQFEIEKELRKRRLRTKIVLQEHDSLYVDSPIEEAKKVDKFVGIHLTNPPLLGIISRELGRTVPLLYKKEILI